LKASDLNSDSSSEIADGDDSSKNKNFSRDSSRRKSISKAVSKANLNEEFQPALEGNNPVPNQKAICESVDEETPETFEETATTIDSEGENDQLRTPTRKDFDKISPEKNPLEEMQEDNVFVDADKDRNEDEIDK